MFCLDILMKTPEYVDEIGARIADDNAIENSNNDLSGILLICFGEIREIDQKRYCFQVLQLSLNFKMKMHQTNRT